jgi:hypothetical protein
MNRRCPVFGRKSTMKLPIQQGYLHMKGPKPALRQANVNGA